jgi:hypothetical protein
MRHHRSRWAVLVCILSSMALSQSRSLVVERKGEELYVSAPQLHFLRGKALEMLHNGSTVTYIITLTAASEHSRKPDCMFRERFMVSYDLWEEKYSVVQGGAEGRSASRLSAAAAEAWCLENVPVPVRAVPEQRPFVIKLECSVDESETGNGDNANSALTLSGLIDIFSRKGSQAPLRWESSSEPLRLSDLKSIK